MQHLDPVNWCLQMKICVDFKVIQIQNFFLIPDLWNIQVGKCIDFTKPCRGPRVFLPAHECRSRIWKTVFFKSNRSFPTFVASLKPTALSLTLILNIILNLWFYALPCFKSLLAQIWSLGPVLFLNFPYKKNLIPLTNWDHLSWLPDIEVNLVWCHKRKRKFATSVKFDHVAESTRKKFSHNFVLLQ